MNGLFQDFRDALRQLRLSPAFALVAISSLALGIGANTAIFQLLDAVRLRNLPIPSPQELAELRIVGGNHGFGVTNGQYAQLTRPVWREIREHHEPFSGIFAWSIYEERIGKGANSRSVRALEVSREFFPVLGVQPWRGNLVMSQNEESACTISGVVVSYPYWQSQMGGRELDGNNTLVVDGHITEVIGVTPPGFFGLVVGESFDIAVPLCYSTSMNREVFDVSIMGRLRPGWSLERASAELSALSPGIFEATAPTGYSSQAIQQFKQYRLAAYPASAGVSALRANYESSLWLLLAMTGLVLLIACANLANLMLARASTREREIAVRLALGASRARLLRHSLVESGLLAGFGTSLGIVVAGFLSRALVWSISTRDNMIILSTATDWRVLFFTSAVAIFACAVFGVAPALRATAAEPVSAMKAGGRGIAGNRQRFSTQRWMVVTQISVSLVLLVGALLFVRSFRNLVTIDPGMRERGITVVFAQFQQSHVAPEHYEDFKRELLDEVRSVPGVLDAATTTNQPLLGGSWTHQIHIGSAEGASKFTWVSADYFKTMGIPLLSGRELSNDDMATSPRVAIVNQRFIRQFLSGTDPIGRTLRTSPEPGYPATVYQIVGVIPDTKYSDIRGDTPPMVFAPASQYPAQRPWTAIMVYSNAFPEQAIRRTLAQSHPEIVTDFGDFQAGIREGLIRERLMAMLSGAFGLLAALLAMLGLYGVISFTVARRRNEIGIRVALGADRRQVMLMVMREAGILLVIGLVIGAALSAVAGRGAGSLLFGLKPSDPLSLAVSVLLLSLVALFASYIPARRAAKVDPMVALRYE
jgi:predicted permease